MPSKDLDTHDLPRSPATRDGWRIEDQQKVVQFKPDSATAHAQWVVVRGYRWVPPRPQKIGINLTPPFFLGGGWCVPEQILILNLESTKKVCL